MNTIVIKIGGAAGLDFAHAAADIAELIRAGNRVVVVHGGSDATNDLSRRLGIEPTFLTSPSGHTSRRTDAKTLEVFQMACRGLVNPRIVLALQRVGVQAVGISGLDAGLWTGPRKNAVRAIVENRPVIIRDDYTGTVERVNTRVLTTLLEAGFTPVIAPPALAEDGTAINIDADRAAAQTAAALRADSLILLTNVPGLLRAFPDESSLIPEIARAELAAAEELAQGRMKKKIMGAREALEGGVSRAIIADGRVERPISRALAGTGTVIR